MYAPYQVLKKCGIKGPEPSAFFGNYKLQKKMVGSCGAEVYIALHVVYSRQLCSHHNLAPENMSLSKEFHWFLKEGGRYIFENCDVSICLPHMQTV